MCVHVCGRVCVWHNESDYARIMSLVAQIERPSHSHDYRTEVALVSPVTHLALSRPSPTLPCETWNEINLR